MYILKEKNPGSISSRIAVPGRCYFNRAGNLAVVNWKLVVWLHTPTTTSNTAAGHHTRSWACGSRPPQPRDRNLHSSNEDIFSTQPGTLTGMAEVHG